MFPLKPFSVTIKSAPDQQYVKTKTAEEGMARAEENADAYWKREAEKQLEIVCRKYQEFTADHVSGALAAKGFTTPNLSALGPVMKRGQKKVTAVWQKMVHSALAKKY